mmetsp:Transcript_51983/g.111224  ORF Transcript_51983/g.111224 Transcript_51983/m.111224 type:complete len:372 (+) Transcript_51983:1435-2550(+)
MTCSSARPNELPAARARLSASSESSWRSLSRASVRVRRRRISRRSNPVTQVGTRSWQSFANRSSRSRAAEGPHNCEAGKGSSPCRSLSAAAPMRTVRLCCGSKRRQSSRDAPGSRQTSKLEEEPRWRNRISSSLAGTPALVEAPLSGRPTTSRLAQPWAERRKRRGSTFRRCPRACAAASFTWFSQRSPAGPSKVLQSSEPQRSSKHTGWRMPGATSNAAALEAMPCSPSNAATSSLRAAMPPRSTHSGKRSMSSVTPSTSTKASSLLRISLKAQAIPFSLAFFLAGTIEMALSWCLSRFASGVSAGGASRPPPMHDGVEARRAGVGDTATSVFTFFCGGGKDAPPCSGCCCNAAPLSCPGSCPGCCSLGC